MPSRLARCPWCVHRNQSRAVSRAMMLPWVPPLVNTPSASGRYPNSVQRWSTTRCSTKVAEPDWSQESIERFCAAMKLSAAMPLRSGGVCRWAMQCGCWTMIACAAMSWRTSRITCCSGATACTPRSRRKTCSRRSDGSPARIGAHRSLEKTRQFLHAGLHHGTITISTSAARPDEVLFPRFRHRACSVACMACVKARAAKSI